MKPYEKPLISQKQCHTTALASLSDWLSSQGLTEAGITTYLLNS